MYRFSDWYLSVCRSITCLSYECRKSSHCLGTLLLSTYTSEWGSNSKMKGQMWRSMRMKMQKSFLRIPFSSKWSAIFPSSLEHQQYSTYPVSQLPEIRSCHWNFSPFWRQIMWQGSLKVHSTSAANSMWSAYMPICRRKYNRYNNDFTYLCN